MMQELYSAKLPVYLQVEPLVWLGRFDRPMTAYPKGWNSCFRMSWLPERISGPGEMFKTIGGEKFQWMVNTRHVL